MLVCGLISGTSADGVDAALTDIEDAPGGRLRVSVRAHLTVPYPQDVRRAVLRASGDRATTAELSKLNFVLGELFADAALRVCELSGVVPSDLELIGSHGQTVWHDPFPRGEGLWRRSSTLQLGQPQVIAERTGALVVADFRPRDMAAGGQGAPLVPLVDWLTLGDPKTGRIALNLGGIANVTVLPAGCGPAAVSGFDTGPGSMVIDGVVSELTAGELDCDRDGRAASTGRVSEPLLAVLMEHPYFGIGPPKSTGREVFGPPFSARCIALSREHGLRPEDLVATVTALTAESVASALRSYVRPLGAFAEVVASGGGTHNPVLFEMLAGRLDALGLRLRSAGELGLPVDAREAVAFAVLAYLSASGRPGNLPRVTGAAGPVILGTTTACRSDR